MTDWDRIVREHGPMVFGTAWRILGHCADTEDVVQDVFLEAYRLRAGTVRSWAGLLRKMAACRALDRLRQRKNFHTLNGLNVLSNGHPPEEEAAGHELAERLRQAITRLPHREAEVFCLRYFEDLQYEQIASLLNVTRGAVAAALHKAREKLAALLTAESTREETDAQGHESVVRPPGR